MMNRWEKLEGSPFPMGVTWIADEHSFNFSLYSKHAEAVRLLLYSSGDLIQPVFEYEFDYLKNKSGPVWHCRWPRGRPDDSIVWQRRFVSR